jgi:transposase
LPITRLYRQFIGNVICLYADSASIRPFLDEYSSLDEFIIAQNPVRFVDAFVDKLELGLLDFEAQTIKTEGRPAFEQAMYLKLYLYGYLNGFVKKD